jgi:hypothetical protein
MSETRVCEWSGKVFVPHKVNQRFATPEDHRRWRNAIRSRLVAAQGEAVRWKAEAEQQKVRADKLAADFEAAKSRYVKTGVWA